MTDITGEYTFNNKRSAAYWHLRELLDPVNGPDDVMLPPDEDLKSDLTIPKWTAKNAVIHVEPKDSVVKRLKRSPDCGDSVVMWFWLDRSSRGVPKVFEREGEDPWDEFDSPAPEPQLGPVSRSSENRLRELGRAAKVERVHTYAVAGGWESDDW